MKALVKTACSVARIRILELPIQIDGRDYGTPFKQLFLIRVL